VPVSPSLGGRDTCQAAVSNGQVYATFSTVSTGTWEYNGGWQKLTPAVASQLGNDGSTMIGSFSTGTYIYDGSWHHITTLPAQLVG
jgi:hypothetical protein